MRSQTIESQAALKPEGGYVQVSATIIGLLWWSYNAGLLSSRAVRVGLALPEMRIRRAAYRWSERKKGNAPEFTPCYSVAELADYCGLPAKRVRAALRELLALRVLDEFTPAGFAFAKSLETVDLSDHQRDAFRAWLPTLTKRHRVPIARRILTLLCEASAPSLIAVILGACLRCSWLRPGIGFTYSGRLSCAWLAKRTGLGLRAIRASKQHLVKLGWLELRGAVRRSGELVALNPSWHRLGALPERAEGTPRDPGAEGNLGTNPASQGPAVGTNPAGLLSYESLPKGERKDQDERESPPPKPAEKPGPGFFQSRVSKTDDPGPGVFQSRIPTAKDPGSAPTAPAIPPPQLSNIRPDLDFPDTARCLELFRQAVRCGLMPNDSEHSRLRWMAAVERARTVEARNPAGVFLTLVKRRLWKHLSEGQFDGANARIKRHLFVPPPSRPPLFQTPRMVEPPRARPLSEDAKLVELVRAKLGPKGRGGLVFHALRTHAGWDGARYETAAAELDARAETATKLAGPVARGVS